MKRSYRVTIGVIFALLLVICIPLIRYPGFLLFLLPPKISQFIESKFDQFGFKLVCFDMHGDFKCELREPDWKRKQHEISDTSGSAQQIICLTDEECHQTIGGGCVAGEVTRWKGIIRDIPDPSFSCRCETKPPLVGCFRK